MTPAAKTPTIGPDHHVERDILCVDGLSYRYGDGTEALRDVTLHAHAGSTLAIVGPNGAGKTTLLKIILGLLPGYAGKVTVAGLAPHAARARGDVIGWVPQRARMAWDFPVTVGDVVRMGLVGKTGMFARHRREDLAFVADLMQLLGIGEIADRPIGSVSGGQQQRAIIARALAPRPALLLLDEPTVGVDQGGQDTFAALMRHIREAFNVTLVIVSHDLRTLLPECERVACLNRTLHFHDSPSRLTPEVLSKVFRCDLTGLFQASGPIAPGASCPLPHDHPHEGHGHD
jgi:zinc transport system ATP-binding protein